MSHSHAKIHERRTSLIKNASYDNDKLFHTDSACSFTLFSHGSPITNLTI